VLTSGQLGLRPTAVVPDGRAGSGAAVLCQLRRDSGRGRAGPGDVLRINAFVTDRAHFPDYMAARDEFLTGIEVLPASTLVIVSGFTRPEFLVEVELTAMERPR
jgi:enamine deaminase RidA (YjgF/YER057c/UK114 family)